MQANGRVNNRSVMDRKRTKGSDVHNRYIDLALQRDRLTQLSNHFRFTIRAILIRY
ncbi:unnamed protein product [Nezara viridula]|uniref:Uncharacterized protein n=1 Tax=Nezara viridula TaxID=85310 RepID=A0A9P0E892_NEZVI|nr:unnamed protein product [Nezara viridula]